MEQLVDDTRLDERRETCLKATFAEFAIMSSSITVLKGCVGANVSLTFKKVSKRLQPYVDDFLFSLQLVRYVTNQITKLGIL